MKTFKSANEAWISTISDLYSEGAIVHPRGMMIKEIQNLSICITDPKLKVISNPLRKMSLPYAVGELLWYLSGRNDLQTMKYYSSRMGMFSDDGETLNSAYGHRIFGKHPSIGFDQWEKVKMQLQDDPDSRQAIIHLNTPHNKKTKDEVCTLNLQFMIRDGALNMTTNMRSNDIVWGFTYDVFAFMAMQEIMAAELGVEVGLYYHNVASMHLYEKDFVMAHEVHRLKDDFLTFTPYEQSFSFAGIKLYDFDLMSLKADELNMRLRGRFQSESMDERPVITLCRKILWAYREFKDKFSYTGIPFRYDNVWDLMMMNQFSKISHQESRLYIIEGPDGVGKTNKANGLLDEGMVSCILHFDTPDETFSPMVYAISAGMSGRICFDRSFISELAYSKNFKRAPLIDSYEVNALYNILSVRPLNYLFHFEIDSMDFASKVWDRLTAGDKDLHSVASLCKLSALYSQIVDGKPKDYMIVIKKMIGGL